MHAALERRSEIAAFSGCRAAEAPGCAALTNSARDSRRPARRIERVISSASGENLTLGALLDCALMTAIDRLRAFAARTAEGAD